MSESLLRELGEQVTAGHRDDAIETISELIDSFESDRASAARDDVLATTVRYNTPGDPDAGAVADGYIETATELDRARIELHEAIVGYLAEETDADTVVKHIDETIAAYDAVRADRETLREHADDVPLGVVLHLAEIEDVRVPAGGTVGVGTTLENLGDSVASALDIRVDDEGGISTSVSPDSIDAVGPDEEEAIGVSVTGGSTGGSRMRLIVKGDDVRESIDFAVEVIDTADFIGRGLSMLERILSDLEDRNGNSINGLRNRIESIRNRLERIIDDLENGPNGTNVDEDLRSIVNRLEALQTALTRGNGFHLDAAVRIEYVALIDEAIDLLTESHDAGA